MSDRRRATTRWPSLGEADPRARRVARRRALGARGSIGGTHCASVRRPTMHARRRRAPLGSRGGARRDHGTGSRARGSARGTARADAVASRRALWHPRRKRRRRAKPELRSARGVRRRSARRRGAVTDGSGVHGWVVGTGHAQGDRRRQRRVAGAAAPSMNCLRRSGARAPA